ncbi:MAG: GH25 family lysozyme, partial [Acutalibacteraceae bacterium]
MANQVVDVSTFQQTIDWSQVKQDGIVGAMIRAGYGFGTVDNQYRANVTGCENNGIPYGMYHYSYATNIEDAKKEAEFFINNAKGTSPSYPLAMDVEEASQAAMG